jgi:hypothetical protein
MHYPFRARGRATGTLKFRDAARYRHYTTRVSVTASRDHEITVFELPLLTSHASRDDSAKGVTGAARRVALAHKCSPLFPHVHRSAIQIMTSATNKI